MKATKKKLNAVLVTLENSLNNVSATCKAHKIARSTFYDWQRDHEWFKERCEEIAEGTIDFVEGKLMQNITKNNVPSIFFYLKTKGKHRGYIERSEVVNRDVDEFDDMTEEQIDEEIKKYENEQ